MPPREPSADALGVDSPSTPEASDLAEMDARADAARARAVELRKQADAASGDRADESVAREVESPPRHRRRLHLSSRWARVAAAAVLVSLAALGGSGFLIWQHHQVVQRNQRAAEFTRVARDAILKMMTVDADKARDDVQRFADETTGQFKAGVLMGAEELVRVLQESKVVAKASVQAVGVQSMTDDSATVLVAAKSELTKADQPKPELRNWRLVVNIERDGGKLKVSKVEFVP